MKKNTENGEAHVYRRVLSFCSHNRVYLIVLVLLIGGTLLGGSQSREINKDTVVINENSNVIVEPICEYGEISSENVSKMINVIRVQNSRSSMENDSVLAEYALAKIASPGENPVDFGSDFFEWANGKNNLNLKETYPIYTNSVASVCAFRQYIENNNKIFALVVDSQYDRIGVSSQGNSIYLMIGASNKQSQVTGQTQTGASNDSQSKANSNAYTQSEIVKLEQAIDIYSKALESAQQYVNSCGVERYSNISDPSVALDLSRKCAEPGNKSIDEYNKKIENANLQIQEWKRKLIF